MTPAIEKFEAVRSFVKAKTEFLMNSDFEGLSTEDATNKIIYQTMDKAVREKLSAEDSAKLDKANEKKSVLEKLKEELKSGHISEAEINEILTSQEFKEYKAS